MQTCSGFSFAIFILSCGAASQAQAQDEKDIKLNYIPNFLSSTECDHLITLSQKQFVPSPVVTEHNSSAINLARSSYTHFLNEPADEIVRNIQKRAAILAGSTVNHLEPLQVVRYLPGQEFREHHDWFSPEQLDRLNTSQRRYTIFVYLNDVSRGGETHFPHYNLWVQPKKGDAVFWENCKTPRECHNESLHAGRPPFEGIKYGLNIWSRFDAN